MNNLGTRRAVGALLAVTVATAALAGIVGGCASPATPSSGSTAGSSAAAIPIYTSAEDVIGSAQTGDELEITTGVISSDGQTYVSDIWAESDPPQPAEPMITVSGVPADKLGLEEKLGVYYGQATLIIRMTSSTTAEFVSSAG